MYKCSCLQLGWKIEIFKPVTFLNFFYTYVYLLWQLVKVTSFLASGPDLMYLKKHVYATIIGL